MNIFGVKWTWKQNNPFFQSQKVILTVMIWRGFLFHLIFDNPTNPRGKYLKLGAGQELGKLGKLSPAVTLVCLLSGFLTGNGLQRRTDNYLIGYRQMSHRLHGSYWTFCWHRNRDSSYLLFLSRIFQRDEKGRSLKLEFHATVDLVQPTEILQKLVRCIM